MWQIILQEEAIPFSSEKRLVKAKYIRLFPINEGESFGRLKMPLIQVILADDKGNTLRLRMTIKGNDNYSFTIRHPDKFEFPKFWVGQGKRRQQVSDPLAPKIAIKDEEKELTPDFFFKRILNLFGEEMANKVMDLFAEKVGETVTRQSKKSKTKVA